MSARRLLHVLAKELLQLRRDPYVRVRLLVPPLVQLVMFGYAATFEVHRVPTALLDRDATRESRELLARLTSTGRFEVRALATSEAELIRLVDRGQVALGVQIHPGFAARLRGGRPAPVQVLLDSTNSNTALIALRYVTAIGRTFARDVGRERLGRSAPALLHAVPAIVLAERPWYNPDFDSRWFFVPGVIGSLMFVLTVNMTAFAVVRERELGTLEQIMVSPIRPAEFVLGKTLPAFALGMALAALITALGTFWFGIPFRGSVLVLVVGTALFLSSTLGLGLLISTLCRTQQQAFASSFFVLTPAFVLSGFTFPIASMPVVLQWLTRLDPLRYYLELLRASFLKGVGFDVLWPQLLAMAGLGGLLTAASIARFRKSLE